MTGCTQSGARLTKSFALSPSQSHPITYQKVSVCESRMKLWSTAAEKPPGTVSAVAAGHGTNSNRISREPTQTGGRSSLRRRQRKPRAAQVARCASIRLSRARASPKWTSAQAGVIGSGTSAFGWTAGDRPAGAKGAASVTARRPAAIAELKRRIRDGTTVYLLEWTARPPIL
jgi:hypothetical protein